MKERKDAFKCLESLIFLPGTPTLLHDSSESILYFFVSKTINERIQHGDHNGVKNRSHLILSQSVRLTWF
jgi:hypothetical protein